MKLQLLLYLLLAIATQTSRAATATIRLSDTNCAASIGYQFFARYLVVFDGTEIIDHSPTGYLDQGHLSDSYTSAFGPDGDVLRLRALGVRLNPPVGPQLDSPVSQYGPQIAFSTDCDGNLSVSDPGVQDQNDSPRKRGHKPKGCEGMPVWRVSEPYVSLWLDDEPLGYQPAVGSRLSLLLSFKQQETDAGYDTNLFGFGRKWNCSWLSYVDRDTQSRSVVHFAGGGSRAFDSGTDYLTQTQLTGDTTNGFTLTSPDGATETFGFVVTNSAGAFLKAMLTRQADPQGQFTRFNYAAYDPAWPVVRMLSVVDGDGRTNSISYAAANAYSSNLVSQVTDPYGRTASLLYDSQGRLTNLTDVAGISSSLEYDAHDWITNLITPYGSTTFRISDSTGANVIPNGRAIEITEPDGGKELYLFTNAAPGLPDSYTDVPSLSPFSGTLDNSSMSVNNSFHWGKRQYAGLSSPFLSSGNVGQLTANDYLRGRMRHWLKVGGITVSETLSMERAPSPDGTAEGQKTWYDYAGKTNSEYVGTQVLPLFTATILPDGNTRFIRTDRNDLGQPTSEISTYSAGATVALRTNSFAYATNGIDLVAVTNALGVRVLAATYNDCHQPIAGWNALDEQTSFTYNTNQQVTSISCPGGLVTTNLYLSSADSLNRLGWAIDYSIADGSPVYLHTNAYTWASGLPATHTDPRGLTVAFTWDNLQRLTRLDFPDGTFVTNSFDKLDLVQTVDRMGFTSSFEFNPVRQMTKAVDTRGVVTLKQYCSCGSLETLTNAAGTPQEQVIRYYYDNQGNQTQLVGPDNYSVTRQLDSLGRPTNVFDAVSSVTNFYNHQGLLVSQRNAAGQIEGIAYDILDRATNIVNANGVAIGQAFDDLNRLLSRSYPDTGIERFAYSPLGLVGYTNQLNHVTRYGLDVFGRQTAQTNANLDVIRAAYSPAGDRLTLTDANNHTTTWAYSLYGQPITKRDANDTEIFRWSYDANNRLTNQWTAEKGNIAYTLDPNGNRLAILYPQSSILFSFDALNRLTNMVDSVGTTRRTYSIAGELETEDGPWDNDTVTYSNQNRLRVGLTLAQPNASAWSQTYGHDAARRLTSLVSPAGAFNYSYFAPRSFLPASISLPNGAYITNTFDTLARLTGTYLKNSGGSILDGYTYACNQGGLRTNINRTIAGAASSLALNYDPIGQLLSANGFESNAVPRLHEQHGYAFDPAGNLSWRTNNALIQHFAVNEVNEVTNVTRLTGSTLTAAGLTTDRATNVTVNGQSASIYADRTFASPNHTLIDGTNTFTVIAQSARGARDTNLLSSLLPASVSLVYDLNGNLRTNGNQVFEYDDENQLISATIADVLKKEITYDGINRLRIKRDYAWNGSGWTLTGESRFVYDGMIPIQHRDSNNAPILTLTRGLDLSGTLQGAGGIGGLLAMTEPSGVHSYYHADGNGNVTALMNSNQLLVGHALYDCFGRFLALSGPKANVSRYWFSSELYDAELGLYHYPRRTYAPALSRWLTTDPIGEDGGLNLYRFLGNAPINRIDPLGLEPSPDSPLVQLVGAPIALLKEVATSLYGLITTKRETAPSPPPFPYLTWADVPSDQAHAPTQLAERSTRDILLLGVGLFAPEFFKLTPKGKLPCPGKTLAPENTTTLYRAASHAEYADLTANEVFQAGPNSYATGKFFAETGEHAVQWGNALEGAGNFRVIEAQFPSSTANNFMRWNSLDNIGPARFGTFEQIGQPTFNLWKGSP